MFLNHQKITFERSSLMDYKKRIERVRGKFSELGIDALLVSDLSRPEQSVPNVQYLTGFTGSNGYLLITADDAIFFTDGRYEIQAGQEVTCCEVRIMSKDVTITGAVKENSTLGVIGDHITVTNLQRFENSLSKKNVSVKPVKNIVMDLRKVKDEDEIELIKKAQAITDKLFEIIINELVRPEKMTELDLAAEIEYQMKKLGASGPSFDTIVATGEHTALPHAKPRRVVIKNNTPLLIDMGVYLDGYVSDMTRTVWIGNSPNEEFERIYRIVLEAQKTAEMGVRPGMTTVEVDKLARDVIASNGYGDKFVHSLGHGVGLNIHEAPIVSSRPETATEVRENMAFTVEPGIYIEGFGGVRIEDIVVIRADGAEIITKSPKEELIKI